MHRPRHHVFVCLNRRPPGHPKGSCTERGGMRIYELLREARMADERLLERTRITYSGCLGPCTEGPCVVVYPDGVFYGGVQPEDVREIVERHLLGDEPVERLVIPD